MANSELKTEALSSTSLSLTGVFSVASISASGAVSGASVAATGAITGASAAISGDLSVTGAMPFRKVRAVVTANVANLAAFNVSTNTDGVTLVAGDIVLLAAQSTAAQNGPYVVGTVAVGVAPLTRPAWFAAGATVKTGFALEVGGEGTVFKNTTWKAMLAADSFVVDTADGKFYPLAVSGTATLVSGAANISTVPVFSTKTNVSLRRVTASSTGSTIEYALNGAPTAGVIGTGSVAIIAALSNGSTNTADVSTLNWTIHNQG